MSEGTRAQGPQGGRSGEDSNIGGHSYSDSNTNTVEEDRGPKGLLAPLLNLDILPLPNSDTTTLESADSDDFQGQAGDDQGGGRG